MIERTPAEARSWAVHFPGNLRWTNAMQIVKGMAPYAAVAMDEVDRIARRLEAARGEADLHRAWREEWAAMADRVAAVAAAKKLYERVGSKRKHIKIFTAKEGGAEHCQVDHRQLGIDYIGDWLLANM